jgi:hypothetical protein
VLDKPQLTKKGGAAMYSVSALKKALDKEQEVITLLRTKIVIN